MQWDYFLRYGYDRLLTSARISAYVDGTTEMQNERIGAALLKRYGRVPSISSRQKCSCRRSEVLGATQGAPSGRRASVKLQAAFTVQSCAIILASSKVSAKAGVPKGDNKTD